ncbi:MAG: branched-chain amino acid ABC transporter permease [Anaerolineae bacterium]
MTRERTLLTAFIILVSMLLPLVIKRQDVINLLILIFLFITLAQSWNILGGYTGQINLGHAAFFGLGSLATRFLWISGKPIYLSLLAGGGLAVAFALLIGAPAFRLKGIYFAIGTLGLAEMLRITVGSALPVVSALPAHHIVVYELVPRYYLSLMLALLTVGATYLLVNSSLGLGMMAIREEEEAAQSLGVNALKHKLLALSMSAFFAGLAGGVFAFYHVSYYYEFPFGPMWTFDALLIAFIGGVGTIVGPIIGTVFYVIVKEVLAVALVEVHLLIFGALFILVVLLLPGGFVEAWERVRGLWPTGPISKGLLFLLRKGVDLLARGAFDQRTKGG